MTATRSSAGGIGTNIASRAQEPKVQPPPVPRLVTKLPGYCWFREHSQISRIPADSNRNNAPAERRTLRCGRKTTSASKPYADGRWMCLGDLRPASNHLLRTSDPYDCPSQWPQPTQTISSKLPSSRPGEQPATSVGLHLFTTAVL